MPDVLIMGQVVSTIGKCMVSSEKEVHGFKSSPSCSITSSITVISDGPLSVTEARSAIAVLALYPNIGADWLLVTIKESVRLQTAN